MKVWVFFKSSLLLSLTVFACTTHLLMVAGLAQEVSGEAAITQPVAYITMLRARYREGLVAINFEPVLGEDIRYRVYRSKDAVKSEEDLADAAIVAEITTGELPVRDIPDADGRYYYTVTQLRNGKEQAQIIPYQTTTVIPVDFSPLQDIIDGFSITQGERIEAGKWILIIRLRPALEQNTYNLYIRSEKLEGVVEGNPYLTVSGRTGQFSVVVKEDEPYYFIITAVNRLGMENPAVIPGRNENEQAYMLKPAVAAVKKPAPVAKKPTPAQLIDQNLRVNFYHGKYHKAMSTFRTLLNRKDLSGNQRATIHFYMGQCLFYLNRHTEALRYFILSKESRNYIAMADAWIERCLEHIE